MMMYWMKGVCCWISLLIRPLDFGYKHNLCFWCTLAKSIALGAEKEHHLVSGEVGIQNIS
jgi:hypothetical protein